MNFDIMYSDFLNRENLLKDKNYREKYLRSLGIDELIYFKENFITGTLFVPVAKQNTIDLIDLILNDKKKELRNNKINFILL